MVDQFLESRSKEYLYVPRNENFGIMKIKDKVNGTFTYNDDSLISTSHNFALKLLTTEEKKNYIEDKRFYNLMKDREEFSGTGNFCFRMPDEQVHQLSWFHSQHCQIPKLLQFGFFCQSAGDGMQDIYKLIAKMLFDVSKPEEAENKNSLTL
ncbi:MAG: hypothetical protein H0U57_00150 [Tatlockia sp.]|nr:hypothetical protein [Tatlockia sp.]